MKFWNNAPWFVALLTICVATSTTVQARENRNDPAVGNAVMTQEIIDQIYWSGIKRLNQPPLLADVCPSFAAHS